jgi:hypothetical protein
LNRDLAVILPRHALQLSCVSTVGTIAREFGDMAKTAASASITLEAKDRNQDVSANKKVRT